MTEPCGGPGPDGRGRIESRGGRDWPWCPARLGFAFSLSIVLCLTGSADARYCYSPTCRMCATLFGPLPNDRTGIGWHSSPRDRTGTLVTSPVSGRGEPFSVYEPTPDAAVQSMLDQLDLGPEDTLYDLGAGDGRILIAAVKRFGCRAVGVEINPRLVRLARQNVRAAGCGRIRVVEGDATKFLYDKADAVTMYLFPNLMAKLVPKIDCPIVSYSHPIPGRGARRIDRRGSPVYVTEVRQLNLRVL